MEAWLHTALEVEDWEPSDSSATGHAHTLAQLFRATFGILCSLRRLDVLHGGQLAAAAQLVSDAMCDLARHLLPDLLPASSRESIGRLLSRGGAAWTLAKHAADAAQLLRQLMRLITLEAGGGPGGPGSGVGGAGGAGGAGGGRGGPWACKATGARSSSDPVVASSALYAAG